MILNELHTCDGMSFKLPQGMFEYLGKLDSGIDLYSDIKNMLRIGFECGEGLKKTYYSSKNLMENGFGGPGSALQFKYEGSLLGGREAIVLIPNNQASLQLLTKCDDLHFCRISMTTSTEAKYVVEELYELAKAIAETVYFE